MLKKAISAFGIALAASLTLFLAVPSEAAAASRGERCGGILGIRCDKGLFCEPRAGHCRTFDVPGVCMTRPRQIPLIYRPVCGCDGRTYGNDFARRANGVGKRHDGRCAGT